jgi:adenine-specific DNA-methyltransferase
MKLVTQTPKKALKAFLKQKPLRSEIDVFKTNLIALLDKISVIEKRPTDESEEHLKNDLRDFLRDTYYRDTNAINTKDKKDLVIHLGKTTDSEVGVIIEAKRPTNINEMVTADNPNKKALHELILYYLDERNQAGNNQLKQLVMTNVNQWFIVDANYFDKHIYRNTQIKKLYETKRNDKKDNPWFYEEIAKIVSKIDAEIPCVYFDIKEYDKVLRNNNKEDDKELIALFKILSPTHLLKVATPNDSNSLNEKFYRELLHIIGLEEVKEGGRNIIRRKKENRNLASLFEATIEALNTEDVLHRIPDQSLYGENKDERIFNISLELCITWINRILFLKLLEGQLITYHQGNKEYRFLNSSVINDFDELFKLFHKVLAVNLKERTEAIKIKYGRVPYLNSSLFEISELEDLTIKINSLDNNGQLEIIGTTILKDIKKKAASLPTLDYLFQFLDAYDFASEGTEDVQEDNKTIINASVLGKVFEKINGYKDGSIFTPAFITMYMCKQSIRLAVVEKFNVTKKWNINQFDELYNKIDDKKEANEIINSLKICDPAVGSGHFLVSTLNEIIAIKSELGILMDEKGKTLRDYEIEIINDELIITDENSNIFAYNPTNKESNRIQKTLFHEKQTIIENCLFGVDINPNSVKICRLRLWIELLKNAYYKEETNYLELETLPNIDINIKCGNSLLSRFTFDSDLSKALKSIKYDVKAYRGFVNDYKNEKSRDVKRGLQKIIDSIKSDFRTEIGNNDPKQIKLRKLSGDLYNLLNQGKLFELDSKQKKKQKENQVKLEADITILAKEIEEIKNNVIYKSAFEWRFEFPEVLNNNGEFEGFDAIIGNPPYIGEKGHKEVFRIIRQGNLSNFYQRKMDIFYFFFHLGLQLLKENGKLAYITTNYYLTSDGGENLRTDFKNSATVNGLINLNELRIFESAKGQHNLITFLTKGVNNSALAHNLVTSETGDCNQELFDKVISAQNENSKIYSAPQSELYETTNNYIRLQGLGNKVNSTKDNSIFNKIIEQGTPLIEICDISQGILSGVDRISNKHIENELTPIENINHGVYVLTNEEVKNKKLLKQELELIRPWFKNSDIHKYWTSDESKYQVIYATRDIQIENYPTIKKHFEKFEAVIKNRSQERGEMQAAVKLGKWWVIFAARTKSVFEGEKIVCPQRTKTNVFGYNNSIWYSSADVYYITNPKKEINLKYILALLNSKLYFFWLYNKGKRKGESLELYYTPLTEIPVKKISLAEQQPFIDLVEKIISKKGTSTSDLEKKIDQLVYKLYDITVEEQNLIEGK